MRTAERKALKRGRPPTDSADRLRAKVWYRAVKSRGNWTDYDLDIEFVRAEGEERRSGADRRRCFGGIGGYGRVPSPGNRKNRPYDLVEKVNAHPEFAGTAAYFRSPFWALLKARTMGLPEAQAFISQCMAASGVCRPSGKLDAVVKAVLAGRHGKLDAFRNGEMYRVALNAICSAKNLDLDLLALVGGLFREAYLACSLETALILKEVFLELLDRYCQQEWLGEIGEKLFLLAEHRVLFWHMDSDYSEDQAYDDWPTLVVERPLMILDESTMRLIEQEDKVFECVLEEGNKAFSTTTNTN